MNGYAGKILRVNLTEREVSAIPTSDYKQWGGGHGMGSAIFFDLVKDKTIDGFDPANVVTIMTSPLCGTLVAAAGGRTEVQGIGVQSYPIGWFTRGNFGGRFSAMLKYAGWDGVVIEGERVAFRPHGLDQVEFLVAPNPGEGLKPLVKVASGGEIPFHPFNLFKHQNIELLILLVLLFF